MSEDATSSSAPSDSEVEEGSDHHESLEEGSDHHESLLSAISALGRKRRRVEQRSEGASQVSEHHLNTEQLGGVKVGELLAGVKTPSLAALHQRLTNTEKKEKPQPTPLSMVTADRIQRGVAYIESCKQATKWAPIVKKNRESEHLSFPLQEEQVATPSLATQVEHFKPQSEFEREIASVLADSRNVEMEGEELTRAEREALTQLSLEEATERRKELLKMRALMTYYEQKAKRTKKIKSKKFHRIQRKKREAKQTKQLVEESEGMEDKAERLRAQERMTLKHSRLSKWAKQQLTRTHRNIATQEGLTELHSKRQALKQQSGTVQEESDSEEEETGTSDIDRDLSDTDCGNPWLRQSTRESCEIIKTLSITTPSITMATQPPPVTQLSSVAEAFAGDDVIEEFAAEKQQLLEDSKAKTVDLTLPGWGVWGGEGVKPSKKARKVVKKILEKPRKDANIKNVIISESADKRIDKHLVKGVPWPYTSLEQYNRTHSAPLGRHWNTEATFHSVIKPRVTTATGQVIEPLKLTDDVQEFMKRTQKKNKTVLANKRKKLSA